MRYLVGVCLVVVCLGLLLPSCCMGQAILRVNKSATNVPIRSSGISVELPVENSSWDTITARVLLELVSPDGTIQTQAEEQTALPHGSTTLHFDLQSVFEQHGWPEMEKLLWYRLRYTITPNPSPSSGVPMVTGILSVGQATHGTFKLYVAGPAVVKESGRCTTRANRS